ncbi:hypothetical protein QZH41_017339, partial [Actinostola sp. cb2023]
IFAAHTQARKNSALIAVSVVVPLIIIILVTFLVLLFVYKRTQRKPLTYRRTELQSLTGDNANGLESHIYHRNLDQDSALLSNTENCRLMVNLPPKCINGGLELNPAYVEQQIQEAIRLGETDEYECGFHRLEIGRKLGKGAFGHVFLADAYGMNGNPDKTIVAVKILKVTCTATINKKSSSSNYDSEVLSLDGALDSSELQSFAYQIASGMDYLSMKGVLHRDLAARNILVGEDKVLKLADFGLSREGIYVKRSTGKIPLRWLSLEAMRDRIYSTASDVWAFGIVLWEICTLGGFPYPTVNDRDLLKDILDGNRMEQPSNCTDEIYQLMRACWSADLNERPSFQILRDLLWDMQKSESPYVNVDPSQEIVLPPDEGELIH